MKTVPELRSDRFHVDLLYIVGDAALGVPKLMKPRDAESGVPYNGNNIFRT